jgi:ribose transport system permease protein
MTRIIGLSLINIAFVTLLAMTTPYFMTRANWVVIIDNMSIEAIALSGYTLLLISGHFDLSVDGVVAATGITAGLLMNNNVPWLLAVGATLMLSAIIGIINGIVVVRAHINGLIATLTTWWISIGFSLGMTKALAPYNFPSAFQLLGQARIFGLRVIVAYAIVAVVVLSLILHFTKTGVHLYAIGGNEQSAEYMGVNVTRLSILSYVLVAVLAGSIGLMVTARQNAASVMAVDGMTLRIIAAAVIGGCSLSGGKGSNIGGILGLLLMSILGNAIIQWGISPYWQKAVLGGILLTAALSERLKLSKRSV